MVFEAFPSARRLLLLFFIDEQHLNGGYGHRAHGNYSIWIGESGTEHLRTTRFINSHTFFFFHIYTLPGGYSLSCSNSDLAGSAGLCSEHQGIEWHRSSGGSVFLSSSPWRYHACNLRQRGLAMMRILYGGSIIREVHFQCLLQFIFMPVA